MTIKTYNVARVDVEGVEVIQICPYMSMSDAEEVQTTMTTAFPNNTYVVLNMDTYLYGENK